MPDIESVRQKETGQHGEPAAPPTVNIVGERVALGPLRRDLIPLYHRWFNDFAVRRTRVRPPRATALEAQEREYDALVSSAERCDFTVYDRATWTPIGDAGLSGIDYRHSSAFFFITIGESAYRGKGYGTETTRLVLDYAFTALGLHGVKLEVAEFNLAGINAYRKAGFREVGRWRQSWMLNGRLWDTICMDCLATEFTSPVLSRIFAPDVPCPGREPDDSLQ
jgi:RimJ/RimL family protein N-acetyltransferase